MLIAQSDVSNGRILISFEKTVVDIEFLVTSISGNGLLSPNQRASAAY